MPIDAPFYSSSQKCTAGIEHVYIAWCYWWIIFCVVLSWRAKILLNLRTPDSTLCAVSGVQPLPIIFLGAAILCISHSCRSSRLIRTMADQFYYIGYFSGFRGCISWFIPQLWTWWIFFLIARTYTRRYNWVNLSSRLKVCIWLILGPFLHLLFWNLIFTVTDFDDSRNRRIDSQMCCLNPPWRLLIFWTCIAPISI